ncbi:MAG: hypothetical protein MUF06_22075 [Pirellulaceae bacterium]|nr:hypothetical protein [Pirellulaceae bacterium]
MAFGEEADFFRAAVDDAGHLLRLVALTGDFDDGQDERFLRLWGGGQPTATGWGAGRCGNTAVGVSFPIVSTGGGIRP